jgi:hypothetical protein
MLRLDVAIVGFVAFTLLGPLAGGYLAAWLVDRTGNAPVVALLAGGTSAPAIAAAIGAAIGLGVTLRFTAGSLLDAFVGAWPENQTLLTDPRTRLLNLNSRFASKQGDEVQDDGPVGLGDAVGRVGAAAAALLIAGMALAGWPAADPAVIGRIGAGSGSVIDWLAAAFPAVARIIVASVLGILAGAAWSTFGGPAARMEALEEEVEESIRDTEITSADAHQSR